MVTFNAGSRTVISVLAKIRITLIKNNLRSSYFTISYIFFTRNCSEDSVTLSLFPYIKIFQNLESDIFYREIVGHPLRQYIITDILR